jgi:hypothetical protein
VDERYVRNSSGVVELRPVIVTVVVLGDVCWPIELTLTRRDEMGFRMLLGREALRRRFVVDASRSFVFGRSGPGGPARTTPRPRTLKRKGHKQ